jgi:hypothetical protein
MADKRTNQAAALMQEFAADSGLIAGQPPRRYLWTDAFAVCNLLGLAQRTGDRRQTELALQLVAQVHGVLGHHREDSGQEGWISGLGRVEGESHPTSGGLRIGKPLPERAVDEPFDERLEWERDGQYFHYLTKWMHALDRVTRATGCLQFTHWARELAQTAFERFTWLPDDGFGPRRMHWKMSIDLQRPLVASMGQHDPLDGYITAVQLRSTAAAAPDPVAGPDLETVTEGFAAMIRRGEWSTNDPLGLGGLLCDAWRIAQVTREKALPEGLPEPHLFASLLDAALMGLKYYANGGELRLPAEHRLAFRELGLAIGLHAVERMWQSMRKSAWRPLSGARVRERLDALMQYDGLREDIESFWLIPANRRTSAWHEHADINQVMLATSLAPGGFLDLPPARAART